MIFYIRDEFEYKFGMSTYIPVTCPVPVFYKGGKSVKLDLVQVVTTFMSLVSLSKCNNIVVKVKLGHVVY